MSRLDVAGVVGRRDPSESGSPGAARRVSVLTASWVVMLIAGLGHLVWPVVMALTKG